MVCFKEPKKTAPIFCDLCFASIYLLHGSFFRKENYVEQMGLYLIVILTFVSIHSIIFRAKSQKPFLH